MRRGGTAEDVRAGEGHDGAGFQGRSWERNLESGAWC